MHQKISEIPNVNSFSAPKSKRTGDWKILDWCMDTFWMHSKIVNLINFRMGFWTTINHFTTLHLLNIWDFTGWWNILIPTKGSCQHLITSVPNLWKVTLMTPSETVFPVLLYYTLAGLYQIRSFKFMSFCQLEERYGPSLSCARSGNNLYYVLKLMNMSSVLNKVQRSALLGCLCWRVRQGCQMDWKDAYCTWLSNC